MCKTCKLILLFFSFKNFKYQIELFEFTNETHKFTILEKGTMAKRSKHRQGHPAAQRHGLNPTKLHSRSHPTNQLNFSTKAQMLHANKASVTFKLNIQLNYINKPTHKEKKR